MTEQPTGIVTLLFTDIEGSTRVLERLGQERYRDSLELHRRLLRQAFDRHGGYEVDYEGDAFFVTFRRAGDAVAAAAEAQQALAAAEWPEGLRINVRMGIHTGEPLPAPPKYVGLDVHKAARVMAAGHGGQVLLTKAARAGLSEQVAVRELGSHQLKDLLQPEPLYQLLLPGLRDEFPALKTLGNRPNNLPVVATPFIGRRRELAAVQDMMLREQVRLLTLVGSGGIGKTRLALQAAADASDVFQDGVYWVPLAPIRDPKLLAATVGQTLGLREEPGEPVESTLGRYLADKRLLLVLDNLEHLIEPARELVASLLAGSRELRVLTTSREPLRVRAEQLYHVPPLALPDEDGSPAQNDAVQLFVSRAQAAEPGFALTDQHASAVTAIVHRLEGLPLAIELAAAHTRALPPPTLLERLDDRFRLLTSGPHDAEQRHRTLLATIQWSYDLLTPDEQTLFTRLGVFVGGCRIDAAEAVRASGLDIVDGIGSLIDKSLLRRREDADGQPRYWMLETIREYALRQLELRREEPAARRAHGRFFADWMASRYRNVRDQEPEAFERFAEEQPNLRATLEWALSVGEPALAARALYGGWFVWLATGAGHEARTWADRYLATDGRHLDEIADLGALIGVGEILRFTGDPARAAQVKERMVAIIRTHPKEELFGRPVSEELPPTLSDLGALKADENEFAAAEAYAREALALRRTLGHPLPRIAHALMVLGYVNYAQEDFAAASALWREAVDIDPQNQTGDFVARSLALAECALYTGELKEARRRLADAASVEEIPDQTVDVALLRALALFAAERGDPYRVAALFGAADRLMEKQGLAVLGRHELRLQGRALADARATLGDAFEEASCGLELETHAQVLALAREELAIAARAETPIA